VKSPLELSSAADTVVGESVTLSGELHSPGNIVIDGRVTGDVTAAGEVTVGRTGVIEGNLQAGGVQISGRIHGDVRSLEKCELRYSAHLSGDISCQVLEVHPGAYFRGTVIMREPEAEVAMADAEEHPEA
jgi:cytoskeletal protein CcmA (bactofilin family)